MPRQAKQASRTGIYHLIVRGINREAIFHDDEDRQRYLDTADHSKGGGHPILQ